MAKSDAFYREMVDVVIQALDEFGTEITVSVPGQLNDETLEKDPPVEQKVLGLYIDRNQALQLGDGTVQIVGTRYVLLAPTFEVEPTMELIESQYRRWPMTKLITIKPADVVCCYMLDVTL